MSVTQIITYVSPDTATSNATKKTCQQLGKEFTTLSSIQELFPLLSDTKYATDLVLIDIEKFYDTKGVDMFDIISTLSTLINCTVCRRGPGKPTKRTTIIAAAVDITTDPRLIKEILGTGIKGVYPRGNDFTTEEKELAICELLNGHHHVPTKINALFNKKKKIAKAVTNNEIVLTPRQEQIINLIFTRGASNKVIARVLKISESTVKLHVSAILKKYGVKNRTQLVVFSKESSNIR
jgi:DNA-binding NarL/FixJ family response regulator